MDRETFAKLALARLERAMPGAELCMQDADFTITYKRSDQFEGLVQLANFYAEHESAAPDARDAVFARLERSAQMVDSNESLDEIRVNLVPRIKPRRLFTVDLLRQIESLGADAKAKTRKQGFYHRPLAELLGVAVAIDRPDQVAYIQDPERYGVPGPELASIALENLRRMTKGGLEEVKPGLWRGQWSDDYAVERMLLPELWDIQLDGSPVVFVSSTEKIYVGGSRDHVALEQALNIAQERADGPRGFGPLAFVRENETWKPFDAKGALAHRLGDALARHLADAYAAQKEQLQEEHPDLFVASVMGKGADDQLLMTFATWSKGVPSLLPRTTHIAFVEPPTKGAIVVTWEDMVEAVGQHMKQMPDIYPPRWRVVIFPSAPELDSLRASAEKNASARAAGTATPSASRGLNRWVVIGVVVAIIVAYYACGH